MGGLDLAGKLHHGPNANYNGSDTFTYKANDGTPIATLRPSA